MGDGCRAVTAWGGGHPSVAVPARGSFVHVERTLRGMAIAPEPEPQRFYWPELDAKRGAAALKASQAYQDLRQRLRMRAELEGVPVEFIMRRARPTLRHISKGPVENVAHPLATKLVLALFEQERWADLWELLRINRYNILTVIRRSIYIANSCYIPHDATVFAGTKQLSTALTAAYETVGWTHPAKLEGNRSNAHDEYTSVEGLS